MSKAELAERLMRLSNEMLEVSVEILYTCGMDAEASEHAKELHGASMMVEQWSRHLEQQA